MFYVIWDDHTGQRHERCFDSWDDAKREVLALMDRSDVEYIDFGPV